MLPIENPEDVFLALREQCRYYEYSTGEKEYEICMSENLFAVLNRLNSNVMFDLSYDVRNGERTLWGHPINVVPNKPPLWFLLGEGRTLHPPLRPW